MRKTLGISAMVWIEACFTGWEKTLFKVVAPRQCTRVHCNENHQSPQPHLSTAIAEKEILSARAPAELVCSSMEL